MATAILTDGGPSIDEMGEEDRKLNFLVLYEDVAAGKLAMHLLAFLLSDQGGQAQTSTVLWSFKALADSDIRAIATEDARQADILVIVTKGLEPLSTPARQWFESAVMQKRGTDAAVVCLSGAEDAYNQSPWLELPFIAHLVEQSQLTLFTSTIRLKSDALFEQYQHRADARSLVLNHFLERETRHPRQT
jgi:hypothetical protein